MKTTVNINSAMGKALLLDFEAKTIVILSTNAIIQAHSFTRANPAREGHTNMLDWPTAGTHYISIKDSYISLDGIQAEIFNKAYAIYWQEKIISDQQKLDTAIPGLSALQDAINQEENYRMAFNRMMEDEYNDGANPPSQPKVSSEELSKQYPLAALYVKAEGYSNASHHLKTSAGNKAKEVLERSGDMEKANELLDNWLPDNAFFD